MKYWIFKYNPDIYDLDARMDDPTIQTTWRVSRYKDEFQPGDTAFIWETGKNRRIRAVLEITSHPEDMLELDHERQFWKHLEGEPACRARANIARRHLDIGHKTLRQIPVLEDLSVFVGFQQGTNFPVTSEQGAVIQQLIEGAK